MVIDKLNKILIQIDHAKELYELELKKMPEGKLLRSSGRYYVVTKEDGETDRVQQRGVDRGKRRGITRDKDAVKAYARKELLTRTIPILDHNIKTIKRAIESYRPCDVEDVIVTLSKSYQSLPTEMFLDPVADLVIRNIDTCDQKRIASHSDWGSQPYEAPNYKPEGRTLRTSRGERMRSKSEVLIAEKLYEYRIPFRYEQQLELNGATLHPDFTFEGAGGRLFYLEFCGMMDDPGYVESFKWRRGLYESNAINEWTNMIYLFASDNNIDMMHVDDIVRNQVIPWL